MTWQTLLTLPVALAFSAVHLCGPQLLSLGARPRSAWLSLAGGISIAYVFVHLLPELAGHQALFKAAADGAGGLLQVLERHVYVIALIGLAVFQGLDRLARADAGSGHGAAGRQRPHRASYQAHLAVFTLYNVVIGYLLLHREDNSARGLVIYAVALGVHFVVNDQSLRDSHGESYDARGRWTLAAAPLLGWGLGLALELPQLAISALFAFLAGGIVLNVLKEELPPDRQSRFWAFACGAGGYAALLLAI